MDVAIDSNLEFDTFNGDEGAPGPDPALGPAASCEQPVVMIAMMAKPRLRRESLLESIGIILLSSRP